MAQSVMHESNLVYDTAGDENKDEGTNMKMDGMCGGGCGMGGQSPRARHEMRRTLGAMGRRGTASTGGEHDGEHDNDNHQRVHMIRQVPSEFAIVVGGQSENGDLGENDIEMRTTIPIPIPRLGVPNGPVRQPIEPTDSNMGCININDAVDNDDDRLLGSGSFKNRPSDADIIAWENQIKRTAHERSMLIGDKVSLASSSKSTMRQGAVSSLG